MQTLGWREWAALPELSIDRIKVKVDTGARTSALHAFRIKRYEIDGQQRVKFWIHPQQRNMEHEVLCDASIIDERCVTDSGGHVEKRLFIETPIVIGNELWRIAVTLTDRDTMKFRMLLGRTAIVNRYLVDPASSYLAGKPDTEHLRLLDGRA